MNNNEQHPQHFDVDIIVRQLEGYASKQELAELDDWIKASPENQKEYEDFKQLWSFTDNTETLESINVDNDWKQVASILTNNEQPPQHFDVDIIVRQLDGYASKQELAELDEWIKASPENQKEYEDFKRLWSLTNNTETLESINVENDWKQVAAQLEVDERPSNVKSIGVPKWVYGIAAGFALLVGAYFVLNYFGKDDAGIQQMHLADGTRVWLNENAALDAPVSFDGASRVVVLHGEAFFDVAHNPDKPFIIKTKNSEIKVLGTSFNVRTDALSTDVVVKTGKVQLASTQSGVVADPILLLPDEKGVSNSTNLTKSNNLDVNYLSWKTGVFTFKNTPVREVVKSLASYYKKPIIIPSNTIVDCNITAFYNRKQITTILESLKGPCDLRLEEYEDKFVLKK